MTTNIKETIFTHKEHYLAFRSFWAQAVNDKEINITGAYHMLYNILRDKPADTGFSPIVNSNKLNNGTYINHGMHFAAYELKAMLNSIDNPQSYWHERLQKMLSIFQGSVTLEMLKSLEVDEAPAMYSDYGPYSGVASHITTLDIADRPKSFADIEAIRESLKKEAA